MIPSDTISSPEMDRGLVAVKATVDGIQVTNQDTCLKAKLVRVFVRERWLKPLEAANKGLMERIRSYEQSEREAADAEALRLNRGRTADQEPLEVEPNIPTVAGAPSRVPTVPKLTSAKLQQMAEEVANSVLLLYKPGRTSTRKLRAIIVAAVLRQFGDR